MDRCLSKLPHDVLKHIFKLLDFRTRLNVSVVCKEFFKVTKYPELLCDIKITFSEKTDEALKLFNRMTRQFECFSFTSVTFGDSEVEFLQKYSAQFVSLSFMNCTLSDEKCAPDFKGKTLHCGNLKTLDVQYSDIVPLFASIPNVTHLTLHMILLPSDDTVCELCKLLSKLEVLSLYTFLYVEYGNSVFLNKELLQTDPSSLELTFASIKQLIEKNRTTLRSIAFDSSEVSPEVILSISEIEGLKLRSVRFPLNFTGSYIKKFCENQPSLASLNLSFNSENSNETACDVCKCLPNLEELTIERENSIDNCIIEIFQLQQLVKLNLSSCLRISNISYQQAVSNLKAFQLKHLNLADARISDESLFELLRRNQNIRFLNVSYTCISNRTLNMICKKLIHLEYLILVSCKQLSDSGLTGEFEIHSDSPLHNLKYLKALDLSRNSLITKIGCIKAIRFRYLKRLSLEECDSLVLNDDFETQLKKQNPSFQGF